MFGSKISDIFTHVLWQYMIPYEILYVSRYLIGKWGSEEA
jgi:hypothetical protein